MSKHDDEQIRQDVEEMRRVLMESEYEGPMCFMGPYEFDPEHLGNHVVEVTINGRRSRGEIFQCRCGAVTISDHPTKCYLCGWSGEGDGGEV